MPEAEITETPQPTKPKSFDWPKMILAAVLGLGLLAAAACAGYWYGTESANLKSQNSKPQPKTQNLTPAPSVVTPTPTPDPTAGWKIYTHNALSFTFKYPPDWQISGTSEPVVVGLIPQAYGPLDEPFRVLPR